MIVADEVNNLRRDAAAAVTAAAAAVVSSCGFRLPPGPPVCQAGGPVKKPDSRGGQNDNFRPLTYTLGGGGGGAGTNM